jgi:hypothetical protein
MLIEIFLIIIQTLVVIITLISVILIYKTIKSNERLNQKILFTNITKEERELKIKLNEYRDLIKKTNSEEAIFDYDSLLFNYYEYLAICIRKELIDESDTKLYFQTLLISVKDKFDNSSLFEKGYAKKEEYKGIQWLFRKWKV